MELLSKYVEFKNGKKDPFQRGLFLFMVEMEY